mgnify:CR=1 FL=1
MTTSALVSRGTLTTIALAGLLATVSGSRPQAQPDPDRLAKLTVLSKSVTVDSRAA